MISVCRSAERGHTQRSEVEVWCTFSERDGAGPRANGFGAIEVLDESRLGPGAEAPRYPGRDAEVVTYVREGGLAYDDSLGRTGIIHAGEFQHMTVGRGAHHTRTNVSRTHWAHIFEVRLRASASDSEPRHAQKRFSAADRRGGLCVVASPDARNGSLLVPEDAVVYSAMLRPGAHVVHELTQGRTAWLHVVQGELALADVVLVEGDGAGVTAEHAASFTARAESEILLIDLAERQ